ncbi:peptidyl-prolyl cis-trans isomerase, FKBP-type family protein [Trichomonas vaginalis G3]|uniref:peptidylprolyl isomerase n=1 Tax=Trichomonas vaginalis (strain ATCC PRA-98 / G3) TaxID=412133 RepID=A2F0D0_TRIV3|nr:peptidyl-prolyl cis-trans isomerase protein [Trichomonas vaginalis G3]EAY01625.1 peptidyl-prolyl cis-trans isomerase, FKBP-type family protein [Trichomonas vaginalis G3]KAI5551590.1 peptidyl-prolyl cis-trans isomerase protein [Trichomonas vaginalis G3]|eukprot:XP_001330357.1 peptidyl-prolyl cis-trans isomerase, FKBP-type family protein [Trichomonas vaginalis G3]
MPIRRAPKKVKKSCLQKYGFALGFSVFSICVFVGLVLYLGGDNSQAANRRKTIEDQRRARQETKSSLPPAKPGAVKVTKDGKVTKDIITEGKGQQAKKGDHVRVHYTGTLTNGEEFDSSVKRNQPFEFTIGQGVIKGWSEGVASMKVGEKSRFVIDSEYGYGEYGTGPIPGGATLIFEIELLEILKQ